MPNSFLWVGLVVLWLFVLFPMLTDRHPRARRTSDVALATRILSKRKGRRRFQRGPATAHRTDVDGETHDESAPAAARVVNSSRTRQPVVEPEIAAGSVSASEVDVDDVSDIDAPEVAAQAGEREPAEPRAADAPMDAPARARRAGRGGFDPEADAVVQATRFAARQRFVIGVFVATLLSAAVAFFAFPQAWWGAGALGAMLVLYLGYLRRQVRIETEVRRRRMAKLQRSQVRFDQRAPRPQGEVRRRPGAVVLELDDEDPAFEYLPSAQEMLFNQRRQYAAIGQRAVGQ